MSAIKPPTKSRDLIQTSPRAVRALSDSNQKRSVPAEPKPSTTRALILRNGKHGVRGTGELMAITKLSGREKLDLLAEDLVARSKTTVMSPFRLEKCLKIAESQKDAYLDDIKGLKDPQLFMHLIQADLSSRTRSENKHTDLFKNPTYVASVAAARIHNTYMLASAWKLVSESLYDLAQRGVTDENVKPLLKTSPEIRKRFLVLYDLVNLLVEMDQSNFSVLATTTPHYAHYFKKADGPSDPGEQEFVFDWAGLRQACLSFLDSIVLELCFPRAPYPKIILCQILRDAVDESPKEARRFPQALWDAIGDLSVAIELQQLLEAPMLGPDGQSWKDGPREMPKSYEDWVDAQLYSEKAACNVANYKDVIFPLAKTKEKDVMDTMWKLINLNYKTVCGEYIDSLWRLTEVLQTSPQWHTLDAPNSQNDSDDDGLLPVLPSRRKRKPFAITNAPHDSDSMPELQSVSNSSDDDTDNDSDDSDSGSNADSENDEYDEEEEDEIRELLREAMDYASEAAWLSEHKVEELDPFTNEDRKGNPFLKLLGSLRGRFIKGGSRLKMTTRTEPFRPKLGRPVNQGVPSPQKPATVTPATAPQTIKKDEPKNYKVIMEEVEDVEEEPSIPKKKKKKSKKKKKPALKTADAQDNESVTSPISPSSPRVPESPTPTSTLAPSSPPYVKSPTLRASSIVAPPSFGSVSSLQLPSETVAQSGRSYLQGEKLDKEKTKVKSRPNHATTFTKKASMFTKLMGGREVEDEDPKEKPKNFFAKLKKKSKGLMHQLLRTADDETKGMKAMKWEDFLKIMREMGFDYDPSTAGSSVRFDPPNKHDSSITFHKPHPDPTIQPIKLKQFAKRLKERYGWDAADLLQSF